MKSHIFHDMFGFLIISIVPRVSFKTVPIPICTKDVKEVGGGMVELKKTFRSEGEWFKAQSLPLCSFLGQETLPNIVSLHPGV